MTAETQEAWYEIVEGGASEQGDILFGCPIFVPSPLEFPIDEGLIISFNEISYDVVGLTQSCDLVNGKTLDVLLCAHWDIEGGKKHDASLSKGNALAEIKGGRRPRCTLLDGSALLPTSLRVRIVDCGKVFCLPLDFVQAVAVHQGLRLRLRSPYREHLSQAFARFSCASACRKTSHSKNPNYAGNRPAPSGPPVNAGAFCPQETRRRMPNCVSQDEVLEDRPRPGGS